MVVSQINDKLLQQKSQLPDRASLGVVLLANRGISLAAGNQASISVEHCYKLACVLLAKSPFVVFSQLTKS